MQVQKGHPKGLVVLFFAEMWERFSFYGMRALLVFYMTRHFLFSDNAAYAVYGSYTALVYATPVLGGLIADRLLGLRKAVVLGGVLMALGHFAMAIETEQVFYFALALLICGNGFFKPNISTTVGRLYEEGDPRRDSGFTIFYMGINLGAAAAPLLCGYIGETYGWKYGFGLAGVGMVFGICVFLAGQKYLDHVAEPPDAERLRVKVIPGLTREHAVYIGSALAVFVFWQLVQSGRLVGTLLSLFGIAVLAALLYYLFTKCEPVERDRMGVAMVLIAFSMVFWAFFEQAGSSINLFTDRNVERTLFGAEIPASVFQSLNALFILMFGPLFGAMWVRLARIGKEPSTPLKFGLGIVQLGLGFAVLYFGASTAGPDGIVWLGWLVLGYLLHTTGELCLSPIGLSMITKLSPVRIGAMMMGTWFLASAFAQYIAGLIAMLTGVSGEDEAVARIPKPEETVMIYGNVFGSIAVVAVVVGVLVLLVSPMLAKRMRGVH
ncbi:MAG TPA: peptide MFS transporter [Polyangiaceae bacterium]|nr:peptide MFS transporter [Polyangiaceae bacterium]